MNSLDTITTRKPQPDRVVCLSVSADLPAGTLRFPRCDIVAVAGVVPIGQQEIASTVVAATGRAARHQAPVEVNVEKVGEITELHLFCKRTYPVSVGCVVGTKQS